MKTWIKLSVALLLVIGIAVGISFPLRAWWKERNRPQWREETVAQGDIKSVVNSTGTVNPVMSVQVGAFVSGPIDPNTPLVEFNQEVEAGQLLAVIDQRIYQADVDRDTAAVAAAQASVEAAEAGVNAANVAKDAAFAALWTREAEVDRAKKQMELAKNDNDRALLLLDEDKAFISKAELDQFRLGYEQLSGQVTVVEATFAQAAVAIFQADAAVSEAEAALTRASATVAQAVASKKRSELNLGYTEIKSPVKGIVIDRKIEPGQTLAASFQTPELFVVAPDMEKVMHVTASVDEADIGLIRDAQRRRNAVEFTVDAYPDKLFNGTIKEVRFSPTTTQNVVTYSVVVEAPNPKLKDLPGVATDPSLPKITLLPGMTASLSFHIETKDAVLKIPNAALRFYPSEKHVRDEDKAILDGVKPADEDNSAALLSAAEKSVEARQQNRRHVWVAEGDKLRAIEVTIGISDSKFTEVTAGELKPGMKLVTGIKKKEK